MSRTITEALDMLDPAIDAHWTKAGLPNLNAVKELCGFPVSRADAESYSPDLTRETAAEAYDAGITTSGAKGPDVPASDAQFDFVAALDAVAGAMTNDIRIYAEALYRTMQYYKSERESIVRQLTNGRARGNIDR